VRPGAARADEFQPFLGNGEIEHEVRVEAAGLPVGVATDGTLQCVVLLGRVAGNPRQHLEIGDQFVKRALHQSLTEEKISDLPLEKLDEKLQPPCRASTVFLRS